MGSYEEQILLKAFYLHKLMFSHFWESTLIKNDAIKNI